MKDISHPVIAPLARAEAPGSSRRRTAIVTGGAGFLGSLLCERLLADGFHVIAVDNLMSSRHETIDPLLNDPRFMFIKHDIIEPLTITHPVDRIYNLACPASPVI